MAKVKQFEKVLDVLKGLGTDSITKEDLGAALKGSGVELYRLPTYIWEIKNKAGVPVETIKEGRRVVGFRLASTLPAEEPVEVPTEEVEEEVEEEAAVAS